MNKKSIVLIDSEQKSLDTLCLWAKNLGFDTLSYNHCNHLLKEQLINNNSIVSVVCNLKNQEMPNQEFINTVTQHKISFIIFSDIPGIAYLNNYFVTGIQFFRGPANRFLLKYSLNDHIPAETPREIFPIKKKIISSLLEHKGFSSVLKNKLASIDNKKKKKRNKHKGGLN